MVETERGIIVLDNLMGTVRVIDGFPDVLVASGFEDVCRIETFWKEKNIQFWCNKEEDEMHIIWHDMLWSIICHLLQNTKQLFLYKNDRVQILCFGFFRCPYHSFSNETDIVSCLAIKRSEILVCLVLYVILFMSWIYSVRKKRQTPITAITTIIVWYTLWRSPINFPVVMPSLVGGG